MQNFIDWLDASDDLTERDVRHLLETTGAELSTARQRLAENLRIAEAGNPDRRTALHAWRTAARGQDAVDQLEREQRELVRRLFSSTPEPPRRAD